MRLLFLLLAPLLGYSQFDTTLTYHQKELHNITRRADSTTLKWTIDTIKYSVPFEIKITRMERFLVDSNGVLIGEKGGKVIIDGYGTYNITKREMHGAIDPDRGFPYFELSNGTHLTWIEKWIYWEWPFVKGKSKMVIFVLD